MSKTLNEAMGDFIVFLNDNIDPLAKTRDSITVGMEDINDTIVEELIEEIHAQSLIKWVDDSNGMHLDTDGLEMWLKEQYEVRQK